MTVDSDSDATHVAYLKGTPEHEAADDGAFWMPYEEFRKYFPVMHICKPTSNINNLSLDVHEGSGACGPCVGLASGCVSYCVCCQGAGYLWCNDTRSAMQFITSISNGQSSLEKAHCNICTDLAVRREVAHPYEKV